MPDAEPWPLSAAVTQVLLQPTVAPDTVLQLALKELVASGAWTLYRDRRLLRSVPVVRPGRRPVPDRVPLGLLDRRLRAVVAADGRPLAAAVSALARGGTAAALRDACRDELVARELLCRVARRWWFDGWRRVSDDDGLDREIDLRRRRLTAALSQGGATADEAVRTADIALLLLLDRRQLRAVDRAVVDARQRGVELTVVLGAGSGSGSGLGSLEDLADISATVDSSTDSGGGGD